MPHPGRELRRSRQRIPIAAFAFALGLTTGLLFRGVRPYLLPLQLSLPLLAHPVVRTRSAGAQSVSVACSPRGRRDWPVAVAWLGCQLVPIGSPGCWVQFGYPVVAAFLERLLELGVRGAQGLVSAAVGPYGAGKGAGERLLGLFRGALEGGWQVAAAGVRLGFFLVLGAVAIGAGGCLL